MTDLQITQVRSAVGVPQEHRGTLRALGLGRIGKTRTHRDSPTVRGMLLKVGHLVTVAEAQETPGA